MKYIQRLDSQLIYFTGFLVFITLYSAMLQADVLYMTHPAGTYIYVTNEDTYNLSVIETASHQVIHDISTRLEDGLLPLPVLVAVNPTNLLVYIATYERTASRNPDDGRGQIIVMDTADHKIITRYPIRNFPKNMSISSKSNSIYLICIGNYQNRFSKIDNNVISADKSVQAIDWSINAVQPMPLHISNMVIDPTDTYLYMSDSDNNRIIVVETKNYNAVAIIPVGTYPENIVINSTGSRVYVLNSSDRNISVIDTSNNSVIATIPIIDVLGLSVEEMQQNPYPSEMAINPSNTFMYVPITYGNRTNATDLIAVIDLNENKLVETILMLNQTAGQKIAVINTKAIPTSLMSGSGKAINGLGNFVNTASSFEGGISMDKINYFAQLTAPPASTLIAKGNMTVDAGDIGKSADLLWVVGVENNAPFDGGVDTTYFVMDEMGNASTVDLYNQPAIWMNQVAEKPFKRNITLQKETAIDEINLGYPSLPSSMNYHFMGYRLQDGTLVYSQIPMIANVQ